LALIGKGSWVYQPIKCQNLPNITVFTAHRNARIASAELATAIPSVRPSVRLPVRHTLVLCQNDGTQHGAVCTVG